MRKFTFSLALLATLALSVSPALADTPTGYAYGDLTGAYPWPSLVTDGVTPGTYTKVTVDAKGRATVGATANLATDVTGMLPVNSSTVGLPPGIGIEHQVRGVVTTNQTLSAFASVTGGSIVDGVTYVAGDRVLLVGQTTKSQNGIWVVGTVTSGTAPLTRPLDFASGAVLLAGQVFQVSEGTLYSNSEWKIITTGAITVDTTTFDAYPRYVEQEISLTSGAATITNVPIISSTKVLITFLRVNPSSTSSTIMYGPGSLTPGIVGTVSLTIQAEVAAGTLNSSDASTLNVGITNW